MVLTGSTGELQPSLRPFYPPPLPPSVVWRPHLHRAAARWHNRLACSLRFTTYLRAQLNS
jgi:hypothetical protein